MATDRSTGARRLASLAGLALVASLLATAPGAAQAQDDTTTDPLTDAPTVVSAGPLKEYPYTGLEALWALSFPEDPDNPVNRSDIYVYDVEVSRDQDGSPGDWFHFTVRGPLNSALIENIDKEYDADTDVTTVTLRARVLTLHKQPGEAFHYRARIKGPGGLGPWSTVGPVSTQPLTETPTPTGFTAVPSPDDPRTKALLSWDSVPADEAGVARVTYSVAKFNPESKDWERVDNIETTTYEVTFETPYQFRHYRLWAVRDYGDLGTVESEQATAEAPPSEPPAPTGVTAAKSANQPSTAVVISWLAVAGEEGSTVHYEVRTRISGDATTEWEVPDVDWISSLTTFNHGDLAPATTYEYQVRAVRQGSTSTALGGWSATVTVTTDDIGGL